MPILHLPALEHDKFDCLSLLSVISNTYYWLNKQGHGCVPPKFKHFLLNWLVPFQPWENALRSIVCIGIVRECVSTPNLSSNEMMSEWQKGTDVMNKLFDANDSYGVPPPHGLMMMQVTGQSVIIRIMETYFDVSLRSKSKYVVNFLI